MDCSEFEENLFCIKSQFFAGVPMKYFDFKMSCTQWKTVANLRWQQKLVEETLRNPVESKYRLANDYKRLYLKHVIEQLESSLSEVADELYEIYSEYVTTSTPEEEFCHRIYYMNPDMYIILKESRSLISDGTTGLVTWQAAKTLAEWCLVNSALIKNRNILELGCGLGFAGITACKVCSPRNYVFTDCHSKVLELLRYNMSVNFNSQEENGCSSSNVLPGYTDTWKWRSTLARIIPFHWDDEAALNALFEPTVFPDIVLASDVIYDVGVIPSLVKVLRHFLASNSQNETTAFIACAVRNEATLNVFRQEAARNNLNCSEAPPPPSSLYRYIHGLMWPMKILEVCAVK